MGISMKVLPVTDDEIRAVVAKPKQLDDFFWQRKGAELLDYWKRVAFLLGNPPFLDRGDVVIEEGTERIHAVYGGTAKQVAATLPQVTEEQFRARFDPVAMKAARMLVAPDGHELPEFWEAFKALRDVVLRAASEGKGLLFVRYEDY